MEGEQHHYQLRSRSRSRSHTPMIFNMTESEHQEHHYDLRSRENKERSHTPAEVSSSRPSVTRSLPNSAQKPKDKSMEPIIENTEELQTDENRSQEGSAPPATKRTERRSERQRAKKQVLNNGQDQSQDNESVGESEQTRKSLSPKPQDSSEEGDFESPPSRPGSAYEIYKQAGEWWNVFPKTDYTYSQTSKFRYQIAPGVLAMPNMSRPSIHSDNSSAGSSMSMSLPTFSQASQESQTDVLDEEMSETIEQNRLNEENARRFAQDMVNSRLTYKTYEARYSRADFYGDLSTPRRRANRYDGLSQVDSDTELDEALTWESASRDRRWRITQWYEKSKNFVVLLFLGVLRFINVHILKRNSLSSHSYRQYQESKWTRMWSRIDYVLQYLYLSIIRTLYLDSWLLSRAANIRNRFFSRRSAIFWLVVLPLLLFAGCWLLPYAHNFTFSRIAGILSSSSPNIQATAVHSNVILTQKDNVKIDNSVLEEIRQSITLLVDRVEKLELTEVNKEKLLTNLTESIEKVSSTAANDQDLWERLQKKVSNLDQKFHEASPEKNAEIRSIQVELKTLHELFGQLKTYCDKSTISLGSLDLEKQIHQVVTRYFGSDVNQNEMKKIVENLVIASNQVTNQRDLTEPMENCLNTQDGISITKEQVQQIVKEILKIYDADKTGRVDYALESAGGEIISIRCTQRYDVKTRAFRVLGFTLYYESADPQIVIQRRTLQPGGCWAFQDFPGYLLIKLRNSIRVTGFTMEHAPRTNLPNNEIKSAPRAFNVWGLKEENDLEPVLFGEYEFLDNDESLQYFPVQNPENIPSTYEFIELRIHSNHGQIDYTCLYRFRVHGIPG